LPFAPAWTSGFSAKYQVPIGLPGTLEAFFTGKYSSKTWPDVFNTPQLTIPSQKTFDAGATYAMPDQHWDVTLRVINVSNDRANQGGLFLTNGPNGLWTEAPRPPRAIQVRVRYTYRD
jgi:outer membrane receptor protein involved in Fe transport